MAKLARPFVAFALAILVVEAAMAFTLSSPAFPPGGRIPRDHTCDGADRSPPLVWDGVPQGTRAFALICDDPDAPAGTWVHWVLYDLPGSTTSLAEGVPPGETVLGGAHHGVNDFRRTGYGGPCPPPGKPHRYFFRLYALDAPTGLPPRATKAKVLDAIAGHVRGQAELIGVYGR